MERTVTMPMAEYDDLVKGLQSQTELIKELKKQDHVVLIDERYGNNGVNIARIICGEDKAKEYLKNDYDMLHKQIEGILEYHRTHKKEIPKTSEENTSQGGTIAIITFVVCFIIGLVLGHYFL